MLHYRKRSLIIDKQLTEQRLIYKTEKEEHQRREQRTPNVRVYLIVGVYGREGVNIQERNQVELRNPYQL